MCGIYGIVFHSDKHVTKALDVSLLFSMLACESSVRGVDATGMAIVRASGVTEEYRNNLPSWQVIGFRRWWQQLRGLETPALAVFGHTRWGTHGANTIENTHPFTFTDGPHGMFIGTHNGQITNHQAFGPEKAFDNDSRNLFHGLSKVSKAKWPTMLKQVRGNYALAFATPGEFHLARNYGSPCFTAYSEEFDATVYASTVQILQAAVNAAKTRVGKILPLTVGELRTFLPNTRKPVVTHFKPYEQVSWMKHWGRTARMHNGFYQCDGCDELVPSLTYLHNWGYVCTDCEYAARKDYEMVERPFQSTKKPKEFTYDTVECVVCKNLYPEHEKGLRIRYAPRWGAMVCDPCENSLQHGTLPEREQEILLAGAEKVLEAGSNGGWVSNGGWMDPEPMETK